jgi:malonate-semialdehyde dehydrogenase (acetylating)/methylmalonate-semialdehyde dehydrogenase
LIETTAAIAALCFTTSHYTFGSWKGSGLGDLNQYGLDAFKFYTKTVTAHWLSDIDDGAEFVILMMR